MGRKLKKAVLEAVDRAMSISIKPPIRTTYKPIKKVPTKEELLPQTTACGGVAVGAQSIPPAKKNKKSKL